jgi:hypothetical protein
MSDQFDNPDNTGPDRKRQPKSKAKPETPQPEPAPVPNALGAGKKRRIDLSKIRADVSAPLGATKRQYHMIPVRKPGNQKCVRTYPQDQWFAGAAIAIREDDKERKPYLFSAAMAALVPAQVGLVTLVPYVDRQLNLCLWPLKHNRLDRPNDYNSSAMDCAYEAITAWGHVVNSGGIYSWIPGIGNWPDPELPDLTIDDIIERAFPGDRYIEATDHPFMQELLGA